MLTAGTLVGGDTMAAAEVLGELRLLSIVSIGAPLADMAVDGCMCLPSVASQLLGVA